MIIKKIALIPSGFSFPIEANTSIGKLIQEMTKVFSENGIDLLFPITEDIFKAGFVDEGYMHFSHSPQEKAKMLYKALESAVSETVLFLTGGSNTEDMIPFLDELLRENPLPSKPFIQAVGFSDATQLHHYLGQRGLCTPICYSGMPSRFISQEVNIKEPSFTVTPINQCAQEISFLMGYTLPGSTAQVEGYEMYQTRYFLEGTNFLVTEVRHVNEINSLREALEKVKEKKIALLLSGDTDMIVQDNLSKNPVFQDIPIFKGLPFGHNKDGFLGENAKPIPLFVQTVLQRQDERYQVRMQPSIDPYISEKLDQTPRIEIPRYGADKTVLYQDMHQDGCVMISNLNCIQKDAKCLTLDISALKKDTLPQQAIEAALKKLYLTEHLNAKMLKDLIVLLPQMNFETNKKEVEESRFLQNFLNHNQLNVSLKIKEKEKMISPPQKDR